MYSQFFQGPKRNYTGERITAAVAYWWLRVAEKLIAIPILNKWAYKNKPTRGKELPYLSVQPLEKAISKDAAKIPGQRF